MDLSPNLQDKMDLRDRDRNAIQYSKSILDKGDTLVLIKYPNDLPAYDSTGFPLRNIHLVDSAKLRATGSEWFKLRLDSQWHNHRAAKKAKVFPGLPDGIKYVIDMTPPEEGDDALQLTADLSCSLGVRKWHTAVTRLNVSRALVGGKDETTSITRKRDSIGSKDDTPCTTHKTDSISQPTSPIIAEAPSGRRVSELSTAVTSIIQGETSGIQYLGVQPDVEPRRTNTPLHYAFDMNDDLRDFDGSDEEPSYDEKIGTLNSLRFSEQQDDEDVLDYCPIRHRAGIERLLQVIEGKDPRLDSAPKVWTLAVLAKYFDCASTAVDYIVTWVIGEPNCRFMEILPETTLKLGLTLKNAHLTRSGYAILVSEEALRVGTGKYFQDITAIQKNKPSVGKDITRFGRAREDLDEDILNSIQHAGRHFSARIEQALAELLDPEMKWLLSIPEFGKLIIFDAYLDAAMTPGSPELRAKKLVVSELIGGIHAFIRGRILYCLLANLSYQQSKVASDHRDAERWQGPVQVEVFDCVYNNLADHERMVTRGFWTILRDLEWVTDSIGVWTNQIHDALPKNNPYHNLNEKIADKHGIKYTSVRILQARKDEFNDAVLLEMGRRDGSDNGQLPEVASSISGIAGTARSIVDGITQRIAQLPFGNEVYADETLQDFWAAQKAVEDGKGPRFSLSVEDAYLENNNNSPLFSLPVFLNQVGLHLRSACSAMLSRGENDWSIYCDTLLCLSDEEYKYLPLWAGGMDDGSGGVFEEEIPPAEKGPTGPGPAFHTGSTANSMIDSDFDFDGRSSTFDTATMEGIQTSLGVEDGFSDHLDRRVVYSEDDFPMEHAALPVHTRVGESSGSTGTFGGDRSASNVQDHVGHSASVPAPVSTSHFDDDDFFILDEEDLDLDSEGTLTETE